MALAESRMSKTYRQRMDDHEARIRLANYLLDTPTNRKQERQLARSKERMIIPAASKPKKRRAKAKKNGTLEVLERRVAFFGPDYVFGSRENRLRLPQGLHSLNREETKRLIKLRKRDTDDR